MKTLKLETWTDTHPAKMVAVDHSFSTKNGEEAAKDLASFLLNNVRGDALELIIRQMVLAIQYDHPEYSELSNDVSRAYSALYHLEGREI